MSKSRRPNQATIDELQTFFDRSKSILGKTGLYYDPITKKFRKAITQNGKVKGSGRELKLERKFAGYLKKLGDDEKANILKDASARAIDKGFSALQKERKAFLKEEAKKRDIDVEQTTPQEVDSDKKPEPKPNKQTPNLRGAQVEKKNKQPDPNNIRMEVIDEGEQVEARQKQKVVQVEVTTDGSTTNLAEASGEVDDAKLGNLRGQQAEPQEQPQPEEPQTEAQQETQEPSPTQTALPPATDKPEDRVVEEIKPVPSAPPMVAPSSQKVSMERNRMKYSPEKLRAEIKAFVTIYRDDIKTPRFKQLANTKLEGLSLDKLRELHRNIEEEVIEYYGKQTGLRLGVIIDPSVLGLSVQRLQGVLAPQLNLPTAPVVRDVGSVPRDITGGRQLTRSADTHYHVGGIQQATKQILPEGQNLQQTSQGEPQATPNRRDDKTRIKIPIQPPRRHLFQPSRRAKIPANIVIRG
tara:strand:+ start:2976 stop:4376 length:1401 start_codon:yes stop_codon:yes gene_type:complete